MGFWIAAVGMGVAVIATLLVALLRGGDVAVAGADIAVYRDQLREVDRDTARGLIAPEEATRLRAEIGRRALDADRAQAGQTLQAAPRRATQAGMLVIMAGLAAGISVYARLGAPGVADQPMAARLAQADATYQNRPAQAVAEAAAPSPAMPAPDPAFADLMTRLRTALADRPDDLEGHRLLAKNEAALANFSAAMAAQARVISLLGAAATGEDHAALAELQILAAGGVVTPEAEAELNRALTLDAGNGMASYYLGLLQAQTGRPDRAFALWAALLDRSAPGDPWVPVLRASLPEMALRAGVRYSLPPEAPGPDAAEIAAAAELSPADREAMIRGMVDRLGARLATEGGPAADWARLIAAYGVLGETTLAAEIWTEAQTRFAGRDADLAMLRQAADGAGVAP